MRRMVDVLRQDGESTGAGAASGARGPVDRLVEKFREAGLPVSLRVEGRAAGLAPGLDLTAYRLVQEGLTNALRHAAAPRRAEVTIVWDRDQLELAVRDDGAVRWPRPAPATDCWHARARRGVRREAGRRPGTAGRLRAGRDTAAAR